MTVVIPTLGGDCLEATINALNAGSIVPAEILICVPAADAHKTARLAYGNVKVVVTDVRGQVPQRAIGFQNASQEIIMQLDDDMLVEERCVEYLVETLATWGPNAAVAPALFSSATGASIYKRPERATWLDHMYNWIMNGAGDYRPGTVYRAGLSIGVDTEGVSGPFCDVEWLPGGCVLHLRQNVITASFYPFAGKAYCEDLLHSLHLRNRGCRLIIDTRARCWMTPFRVTALSVGHFVQHVLSDYRARRYYVRTSSRSILRMHCYYCVYVLAYVIGRATGDDKR